MKSEFCPEVYLFRGFLLQHGAPLEGFATYFDYSEEWRRLSENYMVNQFVLLDDAQLGIRCLKYPDLERKSYRTSIDFESWYEAYRERFDPTREELALSRRLEDLQRERGLKRRVKRLQLLSSKGRRAARLELKLWGLAFRVARVLLGWTPMRDEIQLFHKQTRRYRRLRSSISESAKYRPTE